MIKKEELIRFYQDIETQEEQVKAGQKNIKESFEAFAENNEITIKALKKDYKNYKEYMKNKNEFVEIDMEADALTQAWCVEYQDKQGEGAE